MALQVNPIQLIAMIKQGQNPQQLMLNILNQQAMNNPMYANLSELIKTNQTSKIEDVARNLAKERGIDFDKEFMNFRRTYGL